MITNLSIFVFKFPFILTFAAISYVLAIVGLFFAVFLPLPNRLWRDITAQ